jgi:hypothetical protein
MSPKYRIIPWLKPGQRFELLGRKVEYFGLIDGKHQFRATEELHTRLIADEQLVLYVDAGALRLLF